MAQFYFIIQGMIWFILTVVLIVFLIGTIVSFFSGYIFEYEYITIDWLYLIAYFIWTNSLFNQDFP